MFTNIEFKPLNIFIMKNSLSTRIGYMLLALMLIFTPTLMFGQTPEETTPLLIVEWLTPFIVLLVTFIVRKVWSSIPGWATMIVVSAVSAAVAWATNVETGEMSMLMQTLYGLLAVFLNQLYRQITSNGKRKATN